MKNIELYKIFLLVVLLLIMIENSQASVYNVSDKANLQTRMTNAVPGDTIIVADGSYDWGQIIFTNNNSTSTSAWIVLKAQNFSGVEFKGTTYLQFKGTRIEVNGFKFANGSAGTNPVISFRTSSSNLSNYCRITRITIDNYNTYSADSTLENEWVGLYGTNNRIDHCTFINKYNARATVVVWYSTTTYPNPSISTYHRIDSNYFKGRSFQGSNGGETIRIGDSNSSRTNGFNITEFNLFENLTQAEPEIISNKSDFNIYRYNTFKNCNGGLTLRHGRYCSVYGNFFIVNNAAYTKSYGVRVIDKGHQVYNNYFEGLLGNKNSLTSLRCPIILYNGLASVNDTADASKASGYFPAENTMVAFNTIVNCSGGAGIVMGFTNAGAYTFQPQGIIVANNLIKMTTGQAAYIDPLNTLLTYTPEGNIYNAPNGLGLSSSTGFTNATLTFGTWADGILPPPSLVQDAAINSANYATLLTNLDIQSQARSAVFDVGSDELNGTGPVITRPLDSTMVGALDPLIILPVHLLSFKVTLVNKTARLFWEVANELNFKAYIVEHGIDAINFSQIGYVNATGTSNGNADYIFDHNNPSPGYNFYRLRLIDKDGSYQNSTLRIVNFDKSASINIYPNPASRYIKVYLDGSEYFGSEIRLFDAAGKTVRKIKVSSNSVNIPTADLSKGLYHLQVSQNNLITTTYPVMIQ